VPFFLLAPTPDLSFRAQWADAFSLIIAPAMMSGPRREKSLFSGDATMKSLISGGAAMKSLPLFGIRALNAEAV
jgi:hypothetical protein